MIGLANRSICSANNSILNFNVLPYLNVDIIRAHGQFNNSMNSDLPTKKYLDKLRSLHDLDLFSLNAQSNINPDSNLGNQQIRSQYFSPHSFCKFKNSLMRNENNASFSLLHNNVRSLRRNLENFQVHLLDELDYPFSVIGISETKITTSSGLDFNPHIPNYQFEYVPTPLLCGGIGMYINSHLNYTVLEKASKEAFQALWIEIEFLHGKNIICGIVYRQHNSPEEFQTYFEKLSSSNKPIYIMGDFNIDLLKSETSIYSHNFLLSMQSYSFLPVIDKPTRVYKNSATLIDNILVNRIDYNLSGGNIVSDISDHYSQFCLIHAPPHYSRYAGTKIRDYSKFSEENFNHDISQINWNDLMANDSVDKCFSSFYNKFHKLVNKHAPLRTVSKRKAKQLSKPWINRGLRKSIKIKNDLFHSGNSAKYKLYRNKILTLSRLSKKLYYEAYFNSNLTNMKKTWEGINNLISNKQRKAKPVSTLQLPNNQGVTQNQSEIANVLNNHFASVGPRLANSILLPTRDFIGIILGIQITPILSTLTLSPPLKLKGKF